MSKLRSRFMAGLLYMTSLLLVVVTTYLMIRYPASLGAVDSQLVLFLAAFLPLMLLFPAVGVLVAWRRPQLSLGWLYLGVGLAITANFFVQSYGWLAIVARPGTMPLGSLSLVSSDTLFSLGFLCAVNVIMQFPDGRFLSARWRLVSWLFFLGLSLNTFGYTLSAHPIAPGVDNPYAFEAGADILEAMITFGNILISLCLLVVLSAPLFRLRRAHGVERQQLKYLVYVCSLVFAIFGIITILDYLEVFPGFEFIGFFLAFFAIGLIPVATGMAILRYRLWDIDLVIRKTLQYGVLSLILASVYFGTVILLQNIFSGATGQESPAAIVLSTLFIATLFRPVRRVIKGTIDRRFYRRKYDAAQTLASFAQTARDEVDLERLMAELVETVKETMQPGLVALWLRDDRSIK